MADRRRALVAVLALAPAAGGCDPGFPPSDWRSASWQEEHCPKAEARDAIRLLSGKLAPVTILQIGEHRLYVPAYWLRRDNGPSAIEPAPVDVFATLGGEGAHLAPDLHPLAPGTEDHTYCLGAVHRLVPNHKAAPGKPDFTLKLTIHAVTTGNRDGHVERTDGSGYDYNTLTFVHTAAGSAEDEGMMISAARVPRKPLAAGWYEAVIGGPVLSRAYFPAAIDRTGNDWKAQLVGYRQLGEIRFDYPVDSHMRGTFWLAQDADPGRWLGYRSKAEAILSWLETPPGRRDEQMRIVF